jgi:hypothetical protein
LRSFGEAKKIGNRVAFQSRVFNGGPSACAHSLAGYDSGSNYLSDGFDDLLRVTEPSTTCFLPHLT